MRRLFTSVDSISDDTPQDGDSMNSISNFNNERLNDHTTEISTSTVPSIFNHGMVTDAAHKFFHVGKLLETCCYNEALHRWQPILISWTGKQNKETYASHFFTLFTTIARQLQVTNTDVQLSTFQSIIANVVDFSDAQRAGFQLAYQKFLTSTEYGTRLQIREWQLSSSTYQLSSADEHYSVALGLLKGCLQHWRKSVTRISQNHHVVPPERQSEFHGYMSDLFNVENVEDFNILVDLIGSRFSNAVNWLNWWSSTEHAGLLFPALRTRNFEQLQGNYLSIIFNCRNIQCRGKLTLSYVSRLSTSERRSIWYFARPSKVVCILLRY